LPVVEAEGCALAAAMSTGNGKLISFIMSSMFDELERDAAMTAASLMAQNNVWYPYVEMAEDPALSGLPAQLRMNAISTHGGTTAERFESYSLAASISWQVSFLCQGALRWIKEDGLLCGTTS
jgi:lipoyl-dependent peroxiredoxin subunit D